MQTWPETDGRKTCHLPIDYDHSCMSATYSIGASSTLCGVNIETIRYYERVRLMPMRPGTFERGPAPARQ